MEPTYTQRGDYLIPNLVLSDTKEYHIGKYGRMRRIYLKEHRPAIYSTLLLTEKLFSHLSEIDAACKTRLDIIEAEMMRQEGVTEALKAADQMEWVRRRNSIHSRAEEIVLHELVYACREGILRYFSNFQYPLRSEPMRSIKPFSLSIFNLRDTVFRLKDRFSARKVVV